MVHQVEIMKSLNRLAGLFLILLAASASAEPVPSVEIKTDHPTEALADFGQLLSRPDLTLHQLAVTTSTLSDIYITSGQTDSAIILLIRAAIADIQSSTKETAAISPTPNSLPRSKSSKNHSNKK